MKKRLLSTLLALCMTLSLLPKTALAVETDGGETKEIFAETACTETATPDVLSADAEIEENPTVLQGILPEAVEYIDEPVLLADGSTSGTCGDNLTWTLDSNGTLTISGTGKMYDYNYPPTYGRRPGWEKDRFSIKKIVIDDGVTSIGAYAFYGHASLASVTIPSSVTICGSYAFQECPLLKSAGPIGGGYNCEFGWVNEIVGHAFEGCKSLETVDFPKGVTSIGWCAFRYCTKLTNITIPESVISVGGSAFDYCSGLINITVPNSVTFGSSAFTGCSGLKSAGPIGGGYDYEFGWTAQIPSYAFGDCSALTSITIPVSVTSIGHGAFFGCSGLRSITIPDGITSIEGQTFQRCSGLTSIIIPNSVTSIDWYAFCGCSSLTSITIPSSVTSIGDAAFSGCSSLTDITIPDSITSIRPETFQSCSGLTSIIVPSSVTSIGNNAFSGCSGLTSIRIPSSVTSIGDNAFSDCRGLTGITIPSSVTSIGNYVFSDCSGLTSAGPIGGGYNYEFGWTDIIPANAIVGCNCLMSVTIPSGVTSIEHLAFSLCENLTRIFIPNSVTCIEWGAFQNCKKLTDVYYGGDETQWNAISVGTINDCLKAATIHYNWNRPLAPLNRRIENVSFTYLSTEKDVRTYSGLIYDDNWFTQDSYVYNHDLATMSFGLVMSGSEDDKNYGKNGDANIKSLLGSLGFSVNGTGYRVEKYGDEDNDTVGMVISKKMISDENGQPVPLVVVALRGEGYGDGGWSGNFTVGAKGAYHEGFYKAADFAVKKVSEYVGNRNNQIDAKEVRIWLTGYSRSAATANLASQLLSIRGICKRENIYTYTFATPSNQLINSFSSRYNNIFNIVNPIDLVPMVAPQKWNFGKQGKTYFTPYYANMAGVSGEAFDAKFQELSGYTFKCVDGQRTLTANVLDMLLDAVDSRSTYYCYMEPQLVGLMGKDYSKVDEIFCGITTVEELRSLLESKIHRDVTYAIAAAKVLSVISYRQRTFGNSDPYLKILDKLYGLLKQLAGEYAFGVIGTPVGTTEVDFVKDLIVEGKQSVGFMQHWRETYMAWMLLCDESSLTETYIYKTRVAAVKCPVDVEVYDEADNLVARATTKTYSVVDEDSGETYTDTYTVIDWEVTTLESFVLGDNKYFTLPDDQNYRIEIIRNETYEEGDTMTYSVTTYENNVETSSIVYEDVSLAEETEFVGNVTTSNEDLETCTLSCGGSYIEPTAVIRSENDSPTISELDISKDDDTYLITGKLSGIDFEIVAYCATYSESGQLLNISSQKFAISQENQAMKISVNASEIDNHLKLFFINAQDHSPIGESIIVGL